MLINNGKVVENFWTHLSDEQIELADYSSLSLQRWLTEKNQLSAEQMGKTGVRLLPEDTLDSLQEYLSKIPLIVIEFPAFADGRGFSLAKLLRERFAYQGEIRAWGDFLSDQMLYMQKVGFSSFELNKPLSAEQINTAFNKFSVSYQQA